MKRNRRWRGWWMLAVAVLGLSLVGNGQWADRRGQFSQPAIALPHGPSPGGAVASGSIGLMGSGRVERPGRDEDPWPEAGASGQYRVIDACRYDEELQREHELILCQGHRVLWRVGEQLRQEALDSVRWGVVGGALGKTVRATVKSARQVNWHAEKTSKLTKKTVFHSVTSSTAGQGVLNGIDPAFLNPASRFGRAFYVSENAATTLMELRHHGGHVTHTIRYELDVQHARMLDLTDRATAKAWGYFGGAITPGTQAIGARARDAGYNIIKFRSLRGAGANYGILADFDVLLKPWMIIPAP